jgi:hypothetical protein
MFEKEGERPFEVSNDTKNRRELAFCFSALLGPPLLLGIRDPFTCRR